MISVDHCVVFVCPETAAQPKVRRGQVVPFSVVSLPRGEKLMQFVLGPGPRTFRNCSSDSNLCQLTHFPSAHQSYTDSCSWGPWPLPWWTHTPFWLLQPSVRCTSCWPHPLWLPLAQDGGVTPILFPYLGHTWLQGAEGASYLFCILTFTVS